MGHIRTKWPEALKTNFTVYKEVGGGGNKSVEWDSFLLGEV